LHKHNFKMKKFYSLIAIAILTISVSKGQSVWNLSSGDFSFTSWSPLSAPGTYPAGMLFKQFNISTDPIATDEPSSDWKCYYNLSARSRIVGRGDSGIAFINTGNNQNDLNCDSIDLNSIAGGKVGVAVVTLSSSGQESVTISYTAGIDLQSDGTPIAREYEMVLQARIDSVGAWTDFPAGTYTTAGALPNTVQSFSGITLPLEYNNQALFQVRWKTNQTNAGTGTRPRITLDDINITSSIFTGLNQVRPATSFSVYPNPASTEINFTKTVSGLIMDATGREILAVNATNKADINGLQSGMYFFKSTTGEIVKISIK